MGRKWTNLKFQMNRDEKIEEASHEPRSREEKLFDFIEERWDGENIPNHENVDVMFGGVSKEKLQKWIKEIAEEIKFDKVAAVYVTDNGHLGYGWVYDEDGELVDEYNGYEGAEGNDVSGMINDDHYISVSPEFLW